MRRRHHSERDQFELFRALPGDLAPRDAQDLMAYPFFSLAKTKRIVPIDFRAGAIAIRVEAVPEHGMATIWDADVLIWAASQIVEARDEPAERRRHPFLLDQRVEGDGRCKWPPIGLELTLPDWFYGQRQSGRPACLCRPYTLSTEPQAHGCQLQHEGAAT